MIAVLFVVELLLFCRLELLLLCVRLIKAGIDGEEDDDDVEVPFVNDCDCLLGNTGGARVWTGVPGYTFVLIPIICFESFVNSGAATLK